MTKPLIKPRTLKGFRDFLPITMIQKERMINTIKSVYKSYGFLPIDTPVLEYSEILTGKGSDETDKQMYRFEDNGGRDVAMRFDLTIPFARFTAQHFNELTFPFKRYHIGNAWRGENTQAGRYREFMQCDFDTIGTTSIISDIETVAVIYDTITALGVGNFTIHLNNRMIMNGLLKKISAEESQVEILRTIDKLAKIGKEAVAGILSDDIKLSKTQIDNILSFITIDGTNKEIIRKLKTIFGGEELIDNSIERVEQIIEGLDSLGISEDYYKFDLSITRGLDYYTGIVVETILNDLPQFGSICSGGRYDNLAGLYTKQVLPGVGASIGIDRLMAALEELNLLENKSGVMDILILNMDEKLRNYYFELSKLLRNEGFNTEIYPENKKLQKQFAFADKKGFKFAIIVGESEKNNGELNLRKIDSGERFDNIKTDSMIEVIKSKV